MKFVKVYGEAELKALQRNRSGEEKIGQHVQVLKNQDIAEGLKKSTAKFVLIGIPEDIGVRANFGRPGASTAFKPALESFLNQQSNFFLDGSEVLLLGEVETGDLMNASADLDPRQPEQLLKLRALVADLDLRVASLVETIVSSGKVPLVIGGGHNNALGNITGSSKALDKKIAVLNCDPHLDFRAIEGRHSGNGFSYAWNEGYLDKYAVLCMHEQYNNRSSLDYFSKHPAQLFYQSYESVFVRNEIDFTEALRRCIGFIRGSAAGLELDLDAITNVPSSAKTSSGISPVEARQFVYESAKQLKPVYFHLAEAAPVLSHIKADNKTGKLLAYLLADFIKGYSAE